MAVLQRLSERVIGRFLPSARHQGERLADLIYPPNPPDVSAIRYLDDPCCARCGFPFEFTLEGAEITCVVCEARPPQYDRARAAMAYDAGSQDLILSFKHGGRTVHLDMFAAQMVRAGRVVLADADALIPVPLHPSRLRARKFNQSVLLANRISKLTHIPVWSDTLLRTRKTESQGRKSASARRRNVAGAFRVQGEVPGRVVLIDDVMTTGATLEACALTLRRGGATCVSALTLARIVRERQI